MRYQLNALAVEIRESEDVSTLPQPITVRVENVSLVFDTVNVLRLYSDIPRARFDRKLIAAPCSPPTPIPQMNGFVMAPTRIETHFRVLFLHLMPTVSTWHRSQML